MRAWQGWHGISCGACGRNLAYQSGAAVVKCPGCESVLNVSGLPLSEVAGQAECAGCHQIIVFRAEHAGLNVRLVCTTCSSFTRVPPAYFYNCRGCGLYLTYCARLPCVICAVCRTVYPPPRPAPLFPTLALAPLIPSLHRPQRPPPSLPPRRFALLRSTPVVPIPGPRPAQLPRSSPARPQMPPRPVPPEPPPTTATGTGAVGHQPPLQAAPLPAPPGLAGGTVEAEHGVQVGGPAAGAAATGQDRRLKWKPKLRGARRNEPAPVAGASTPPALPSSPHDSQEQTLEQGQGRALGQPAPSDSRTGDDAAPSEGAGGAPTEAEEKDRQAPQ